MKYKRWSGPAKKQGWIARAGWPQLEPEDVLMDLITCSTSLGLKLAASTFLDLW